GRHVDTILCTAWSPTDTGLAFGRDELDRFDIRAVVTANRQNAFVRFKCYHAGTPARTAMALRSISPPIMRFVHYPDAIDPSTGLNGDSADTHARRRPIHESITSRPANYVGLVSGESRLG